MNRRDLANLAKDGLDFGGALAGWGAGLVVGGLLDRIPAQALRVCVGRDYDRAVKQADALADAEAETEVLDPQWHMYGPGTFEIADTATLLDSTASAAVDSPAGVEIPPDKPPASAGHPQLSPLAQELCDAVGDHYDHGKFDHPLWHDERLIEAFDWEGACLAFITAEMFPQHRK